MKEDLRNEVVRRWHGRESMRSIARQLRMSRHTVARVLREYEQQRSGGSGHGDLPSPRRPRSSMLDAHETTIQALVGRYPNITAVRLLEELRSHGFDGGYTIVRQRLNQLRPHPHRRPVLRFETAPGAQAQMDWAVYDLDFVEEGRRRVNLFSYVLGYSRRQYLRFTSSQDFATTIREHIRAFEHLGGAAATCLYDNMKVVVSGYDGDDPIYNRRFLAFATHYGFRPWACRRRRPQTKGKVERPFYFVEMNLLNGRTFRSLNHLNDVTASWVRQVADGRVHRETKRRPIDLYAKEQPHLLPLPQQPYDTAQVVYRTVTVEGFVAYGQNLYSVPWRHIGQTLPVRILEDQLIIYGPNIEPVANHRLFPRTVTGQKQLEPKHRPRDQAGQHHQILQTRFEALGATRFLERLLSQRRCGKDQAYRILGLLGTYHQQDLVGALDRAVRFGAFSLAAVERILAVQAQPKSCLDTLADTEREHLSDSLTAESVPPRPTTEYQLMFEESIDDDQTPAEP